MTMPVSAIPIESLSSPEADVPPLAGASGRVYPLIYTDVCEESMDDTEDAEVNEGIEGIQEAQRIADMAANRTADFAQLCQHYASSTGSALHQKPAHTPLQENVQFNAAASDISKG
ncbi:hypothetical protein PsorP6_017552 [Peronosclerospora sorghi]|uniref:Uncharacterized protein n=1 Tax=Peronosclerospora sorghi TaxID=230839 RepID=A0ACC0WM35_9STRA|nr:hypothetical protein PsorP6_017552 [Peronosclerospora sorghi]